MYRIRGYEATGFNINNSVEGDSLEVKIERITSNKEKITDASPLIFTERSEGVKAGYNIRTDRFEIAVEAMDKIVRSNIARSENKPKMEVVRDEISGTETTQGTGTDK
jgi:hypothetical protein